MSNITKTPGVCGGCARLGYSRITVRTIEAFRRQGLSVDDIHAAYPNLPPHWISEAFAYAQENREEIDAEIEANDGTQRRRDENAPLATEAQSRRSLE